MQAQRNRRLYDFLDPRPLIHYLHVAEPKHVIAAKAQLGIMSVIDVSLSPDVGPAIDLNHEPAPEKEVDPMTTQPNLGSKLNFEPPLSRTKDGLKT